MVPDGLATWLPRPPVSATVLLPPLPPGPVPGVDGGPTLVLGLACLSAGCPARPTWTASMVGPVSAIAPAYRYPYLTPTVYQCYQPQRHPRQPLLNPPARLPVRPVRPFPAGQPGLAQPLLVASARLHTRGRQLSSRRAAGCERPPPLELALPNPSSLSPARCPQAPTPAEPAAPGRQGRPPSIYNLPSGQPGW